MIRTFIAFECEDQSRLKMLQLIKEGQEIYKQNINWTKSDNLHFTYQFIGDTKEADVEKIVEYLQHFAERTYVFELFNVDLKWYPFKNSPLICLMYHIHNSYIIKQHHLFNDFLKELSYPIEDRKLTFHLTLARLKKDFHDQQKNWNERLLAELNKIKVDKLVYYKSTLYTDGPVYERLAQFNLKGGQDVHR